MRNLLLNIQNLKWEFKKHINESDLTENSIAIFDISVLTKPNLYVCVDYYSIINNKFPDSVNIDLSINWGMISMDPDSYDFEINDIYIELDTYNKIFSISVYLHQIISGMDVIGNIFDTYDYFGENVFVKIYTNKMDVTIEDDIEDCSYYKKINKIGLGNNYYDDSSMSIIILLKNRKFDFMHIYDSGNGIEVENSIIKYMSQYSKNVKYILVPLSYTNAHVLITKDELFWLLRIQKICMKIELSDYTAEERVLCDDSILELSNNYAPDDEKYSIIFEFEKRVVGYEFGISILLDWIFSITNEMTYMMALEVYDEYIASIKFCVTIDDKTININVEEKNVKQFSPWVTIKQLIKELNG